MSNPVRGSGPSAGSTALCSCGHVLTVSAQAHLIAFLPAGSSVYCLGPALIVYGCLRLRVCLLI
jgi:hypothetical protein